MNSIMLLDGNSLLNRAFYALPPFTSAEGLPTNAVHGFLTMLLKLEKDEKPDYWVVVFDKSKPTVRTEQYEEYKANRKETPDSLKPQFGYLKEILEEMAVPMLELQGYEADDIIAAVTKKAEEEDLKVRIFTGDRDALQLVSAKTNVYLTKKGISEVECYDEEVLYDRYRLTPKQIIDLKGLMGDASDNIPGVPGVGEKTALKLLWQFSTVENVLANCNEVPGKKLKSILKEYAEQALLSKKLATMICDVPVAFSLNDLLRNEPSRERVQKILQKYSLNTVRRIFEQNHYNSSVENTGKAQGTKKNEKHDNVQVNSQPREDSFAAKETRGKEVVLSGMSALRKIEQWLKDKTALVLSYRYSGEDYHRGFWTEVGIFDGSDSYVLVREQASEEIINYWYKLLNDKDVPKIIADSKTFYSLLLNEGVSVNGFALDLSLAAYLLNPSIGNYSSSGLLRDYTDGLFPVSPAVEAELLANLVEDFTNKIAKEELEELLHKVEEPLSIVLADMENEGITIDRKLLEEYGVYLQDKIDTIEKEIYQMAETEFNINSPQQLGKVLFEHLGLPPVKKTKTGYSTDAATLEELSTKHPIVAKILIYRQLVKLSTTYVKGLLNQIENCKIHTIYQQTVTATGRLSSTEPNLQNIPIRLEEGRKLRKVFKPSQEEMVLLSADYSQIELRILAHISQDPILCESFSVGEDVHARTASEVFDITLSDVTEDLRRKAKAVNFGLMYGLSEFGLARDLGISRKEAKYYIEQYFERYHGVKEYMDTVINTAKETGEVRTILNRLRKIPELSHPNRMRRQFGERIAMNTPIQGTAADIMKIAMLKVNEALKKTSSKMLLQVHDELVIETYIKELEEVAALVKFSMEKAFELRVPLLVDCKFGENWYDLHPYRFD